MIVIAGFIFGAVWGGLLARRRNGSRLDIVQYAAVYALVFALLGMAATIFVERALAG